MRWSASVGVPVGQFMPMGSILHRCDPRVKMGIGFAAAVVLLLINRWPGLAVVAAGVFVAVAVSRIPLAHLWRSFRFFIPILVLTVIAQAFSVPGRSLAHLGGVALTVEGLSKGGVQSGRLAVLLLWGGVLVVTTAPADLVFAIDWYLRPLRRVKVPVEDVALVMSLALRSIPILIEQADRLAKAQKARGIDLSRQPLPKLVRALASLIVPLFVLAFAYAESTADAMVCRCYRGSAGRTRYRTFSFAYPDILVTALGLLWVVMALVLGLEGLWKI